MTDTSIAPPAASNASEALLQQRINQILFDRLRLACIFAVLVQCLSSAINLAVGQVRMASSDLLSALACALVLAFMRFGRIPESWAGPLIFALWLQIISGSFLSFVDAGASVASIWVAILIIGHAIVQLRPTYVWFSTIGGCTVWLAILAAFKVPNLPMYVISAAAAIASSFMAFYTNRKLIENLQQLKDVDEKRSGQLAEALASAKRELAERRIAEQESERLREQFVQSQRLEAIGNLAGGVAHDMNNVLSSISTVSHLIAETSDAKHKHDLDVIREACDRGAALTNSLLGFSRRAQYRKEVLQLESVVNDAVRLLGRTLRKDVRLLFDPGDRPLWVEADRSHLVQVLLNLCINAERAISGSGTIRIEIARRSVGPEQAQELGIGTGQYATMTVRDDGHGMDAQTLRRAFEPFFTTQPVGEGSGLGLAMAYGTLRAHEGAIKIDSQRALGTTVLCLLPLVLNDLPARNAVPDSASGQAAITTATPVAAATAATAATAAAAATATSTAAALADSATSSTPGNDPAAQAVSGKRVLIVDDERLVRYSMVRSLQSRGYSVLTAEDGEDGLNVFKAHRNALDVVVLDMSMPRMNGAECYRHLRALDPDIPIICVSGYPLDSATGLLMGSEVFALEKPFRIEQLVVQIDRATAARTH